MVKKVWERKISKENIILACIRSGVFLIVLEQPKRHAL